MARIRVLRVAFLYALVMVAAECATASTATVKHPSPSLQYGFRSLQIFGTFCYCQIRQTMCSITFHRQPSIAAQDIFLHLPAVASCGKSNLTRSTGAIVACLWTSVLSAGHGGSANLTTTPAGLVVGLHAALGRFVGTTVAGLGRAHVCAGRARSGMTSQLAGMRTLSWSLFAAGLSA